MTKYLFFDLDDTLIQTQIYYNEINKQASMFVKERLSIPVSTDEIFQTMNALDVERSIAFGLDKERYPKSWVETFHYYASLHNISISKEEERHVYDLANSIFERTLPVYPETHQMLQDLSTLGYEMNILTAGEDSVQRKRVRDAALDSYFNEVHVVLKKDQQTMKNIMKDRPLEDCIMIGNSLRSDIHPALENGMKAIHIQRNTWSYDHYDIDTSHPNYYLIESVHEIKEIIKKLG